MDDNYARRTTLTIEEPIDLPLDFHNETPPSTASSRWSRYSRFSYKGTSKIAPPPPALAASNTLANHSVQAIIPIMIVNHPYSRQAAYDQDLTEIKSEVQTEIKRDPQRGVQIGVSREIRGEMEIKRDSILTTRPFSFEESVRSPLNMGSPRPSSTFSRRDIRDLQDFSNLNASSIQSNDTITLHGSSHPPTLGLRVEEVVIPSSVSDEGSSFRSPISNQDSAINRFPFPLPPQNAVDRVRIGLLRTLDARKPVMVSGSRSLVRSSMTPEVVRNTNSTSASPFSFNPPPNSNSNSNLYPRIKQTNPRLN